MCLPYSPAVALASPDIFFSVDHHQECRRLASRVVGTLSSHVTTRIPHEAMLVHPNHIASHPTQPRCIWNATPVTIALLWRCALHMKSAPQAPRRPHNRNSDRFVCRHSAHLLCLRCRIQRLRPLLAIDHTVCSRNEPSPASEHSVRELVSSNPLAAIQVLYLPVGGAIGTAVVDSSLLRNRAAIVDVTCI
jgi:hypothetical protein